MQVPENETEHRQLGRDTTVGLQLKKEILPRSTAGKYGALTRASPVRVIESAGRSSAEGRTGLCVRKGAWKSAYV